MTTRKQIKGCVDATTYDWFCNLVIRAGFTYGPKKRPAIGKFIKAWKDGKFQVVPSGINND